jgi:NAD(P)-dependent dehydrogenase (short-subunit alcohol dehydrogenase family)
VRLAGKVAVVTGAAQGIGLACAEAFAREGAKVLLTDLNENAGRHEVRRLRDAGFEAGFAACDVSRKDQVEAAMDAAVNEFGRLDVLVANAGIVHAAEFLDLEEKDFDRVIAVNLKGIFLAGQAAARRMVKLGSGGSIVNMSSVNAVMAIPNQVPYVVSKGGINQLTKVMALALAAHRIRVNGIGPGTILTELAKTAVLGKPRGGAQDPVAHASQAHGRAGGSGPGSPFPRERRVVLRDRPDDLSGRRAPCAELHGGRGRLTLTLPSPKREGNP